MVSHTTASAWIKGPSCLYSDLKGDNQWEMDHMGRKQMSELREAE